MLLQVQQLHVLLVHNHARKDILNCYTSIELTTLLPFVLWKVTRLLLWWGPQKTKWKPFQFDFGGRFCHKSMTNSPWRTFISSPSFQPHYKAYCILYDQRYMKLLWWSPVSLPTISVCVYKNMCGHKGNWVREGKGASIIPAVWFRSDSWKANCDKLNRKKPSSNTSGLPKDLGKVDALKLPLWVFVTKCDNSNKETSPISYLLQKAGKGFFACWFSSWFQERNSLRKHMAPVK